MANLIDTIQTISRALSHESLNSNKMCFITTNGVVVGTPITVEYENVSYDNVEDILKSLYGTSIKTSLKALENDETTRNLDETILLEDVKYASRAVTLNLRHMILNVSQIVALYAVPEDVAENFLANSYL